VDIQGDGVVTPPGGSFNVGAKVTLIATPAIGSQFARWEGGAVGAALVTTITMDQSRTVMAVFEPAEDGAGRPGTGGGPSMCGAMGMLGLPALVLLAAGLLEQRTRRSLRLLAQGRVRPVRP
jgi:hypothetical protein